MDADTKAKAAGEAPAPDSVAPADVPASTSPSVAAHSCQTDHAELFREIRAVEERVDARLHVAEPTKAAPPAPPARGPWAMVGGVVVAVALAVGAIVAFAVKRTRARVLA
jgi:hypothetical protein